MHAAKVMNCGVGCSDRGFGAGLWGADLDLERAGPGRFPTRAQGRRLEKFTSLVAVGLDNAEVREERTWLWARTVEAGAKRLKRRRLERIFDDWRVVALAPRARAVTLPQLPRRWGSWPRTWRKWVM